MKNTKRYISLDYAKGFAILLLILSHCIAGEGLIKTWIFSFHMPIFFVICGILQGKKHPEGITKQEFKTLLIRRCKQLMIPYLFWGSVLIVFYQILHVLGGEQLNFVNQMFSLLTLQGIDSLWFIPIYLISEAIFLRCFLRVSPIVRGIFFVGGIVGITYINVVGMPELCFFRIGIKILIALIFIYVGFSVEKYNIISKISKSAVIMLLILINIPVFGNGFVGISALKLQNVGLFFVNGAILSILVIAAFDILIYKENFKNKILDLFGKNTIVIVCTNNMIIEVIRLLDYKLTGNLLLKGRLMGGIVFFFIVSFFEYVLIKLSESFLSPVFGKNMGK